jgi:cold shock CspA family protein
MRSKGKIAFWNDEKGYGFVAPLAGGRQVFIHIKAFGRRNRRPEVNDIVIFSTSTDEQGRACAAQATLVGDEVPENAPLKHSALQIAFALLFLTAVGIYVLAQRLPASAGIAYAGLNLFYLRRVCLRQSRRQTGCMADAGKYLAPVGACWRVARRIDCPTITAA